ncbi:hypothetical protein SLA2020_488100 [Shorea laevis]
MAAKRDNTARLIRRKLKNLKKLGAKAAATRAEMNRVREEKAKCKTALKEMKFEVDLLKASLQQLSDDMLLISEAVDNLAEIILQFN